MATDRGGGEVDGRHSDDCKRDIGPGLKSSLYILLEAKCVTKWKSETL